MKTVKKLLPIIFVIAFLFLPTAVSASTLSLSPASGTVGVGGVISVRVNLNTGGEAVNGVSAFLSYPADKLEVSSISYGGSFPIAAEGSSGGGSVRISRGSINPVNGTVAVATINFRGKSLGSATVSFVGGSAVPRASDSSDSYTGGSGGAYTVVQAVAKPSVSQAPVAPNKTAIQLIAERPQISDIQVVNLGTNSATITWKTDKPADSLVEYGLEKGKYFITVSDTSLTVDHSLDLPGQILTPGTKFYFRVLSKDDSGNIGQSEEMEFQLLNLAEVPKVSFKENLFYKIFAIVATLVGVGLVGFIIWKRRKRGSIPPSDQTI